LPQDSFLNLDYITHVRIIDVVGSIDSHFATYDSFGNVVNDPFPTPFESGGFDLDGVGVIHQGILGIEEHFQNLSLYPNPAKYEISIATSEYSDIQIIDLSGKICDSFSVGSYKKIDIQHLEKGVYILNVSSKSGRSSKKLILE
jgi:hypothetical protein